MIRVFFIIDTPIWYNGSRDDSFSVNWFTKKTNREPKGRVPIY
ncbi:MAG: hypothetical protein AAF693_14825 [Bacteroidota bacterium]